MTHEKFGLSEQDLADNDADAAESQVLHDPSLLEPKSTPDAETIAPGPSTRDLCVRKRKQPSDQPPQANESVVIQFEDVANIAFNSFRRRPMEQNRAHPM